MSTRLGICGLAYLSVAAHFIMACAAGPDSSTEHDAPSKQEQVEHLHAASGQIQKEIAALKVAFEQDYSPPATSDRLRCPDDTLLPVDSVVVRVRDARLDPKTPLPLALISSLESDEFSPVVSHLSGGSAAIWDAATARAPNTTSARHALEALGRIKQRRYLAELRVENHSDPKLFRRKDAPRPEWDAGSLKGRLVVYDTLAGTALCQAPVSVRGSAADAPLQRRLRESTRERLRHALHDRAWQAMQTALSSISRALPFPPSVRRNQSERRWAAPQG